MQSFKDKKILIFGLGLNQGGVGAARFLSLDRANVRVTDLKSQEILKPSIEALEDFPNITYSLGGHKYEDIDWADVIIKNPAVKPGNPFLEYAKSKGKEIETDMGIFLNYVYYDQIIGITGTKGKSTTSTLISEILKEKEVLFAGNIGKSVLDILPYVMPENMIILEISSFQLEAFEKKKVSPGHAIITNITPDHLNYYKSMEEYINAKRIIAKYQTKDDYLYIRKDDPIVDKPDFLEGLKGQVIRFSKNDLPKDLPAGRQGFNPILKGEHNLENMAASLKVGQQFGVDRKHILEILSKFKGVPFRLEPIKVWNGVKIINDTTATGPDAGIQALKTFPNCILISGGMNKRMPYGRYIKILEENAKKVFFLEGDSTEEMKGLIKKKVLIAGTYNDLSELLTDIKKIVKNRDVILFSPAATSFNLFENEFDRGRKFNEAVERIFK